MLIEVDSLALAFLHVIGSVLIGLIAVRLGIALARSI